MSTSAATCSTTCKRRRFAHTVTLPAIADSGLAASACTPRSLAARQCCSPLQLRRRSAGWAYGCARKISSGKRSFSPGNLYGIFRFGLTRLPKRALFPQIFLEPRFAKEYLISNEISRNLRKAQSGGPENGFPVNRSLKEGI